MRKRSAWMFALIIIAVVAFSWSLLTRDHGLEYVKTRGGRVAYDGLAFANTVDIYWRNCGVTDDELEHLSQIHNLRIVDVSENPLITDAALAWIRGTRSDIAILDVSNTGVSQGGVLKFLRMNPGCDVCWRGRFWRHMEVFSTR